MNLNILSSHALIRSASQLVRPVTFLRDRYFPTNDATDIFNTDDVLMEFQDGNKKLAPFVAPRKGGMTILREGYTMERYTPPTIAPKRPLTVDDLNKRGFGEALFTQLTPEQRQAALIFRDMQELDDMIARREEAMAAELLLNNKLVMKHYADDTGKYEEMEIQFYSGSNPNSATLTKYWDQEGANILGDLAVLVRKITSKGLPATDLICSPDVADVIVRNDDIEKFLDNRRYELGRVNPELLPAGAALICVLNVNGRYINVFSYDETYTADNGTDTQFITSKYAILTAPNCGRTLYGAVTQVDQDDGLFHTRAGRRIPKYVSDPVGNTRELTLSSRPLPVPNNKGAWIAFQAIS